MQIVRSILKYFFILFLSCAFLKVVAQTKRELNLFKKIYDAALDYYYESKPSHFILIDSTVNREIGGTDYSIYMNSVSRPARHGNPSEFFLDSSWINFFTEVETKRKLVRTFRLTSFKSIHNINVLPRDSVSAAFKKNVVRWTGFRQTYGWVDGYIELSDIILSDKKNKAIVEINHYKGSKEGSGSILLLEKDKKGKWKMVHIMQTWVA